MQSPLPAHRAHRKVMRHRKAIEQLGSIPQSAKQSAVLVLVYPKNDHLHTVFILRQTYKGVHSAQVGFPGGKVEDMDSNIEATALREANEELGISAQKIELLGSLSPLYVPPSNFLINPIVGIQYDTPRFIAEEREVAEVIESPLKAFIGEDKLISTTVNTSYGALKTKAYLINNKIVWGATCMILKEFSEVLEGLILPSDLK